MKKGTRVRVIDPERSEFLLEGVILYRCRLCKKDGDEAYYVLLGGSLHHFLADQLKEIR